MKHSLCIAFLLTLALSCEKNDVQIELPPTPQVWELSAALFDPGDGSGVFESVDSDRKIAFKSHEVANIILTSNAVTNGSFCDLMGGVGPESEAVFDPDQNQIIVEGCDATGTAILLDLDFSEDREAIIISLPCTNPCQLRFERF